MQTTQTTQANQTRELPPLIAAQAVVDLVLDPVGARIVAGERRAYTAKVRIRAKHPDLYSDSLDVTGLTRFEIHPDGSCTKLKGKVSCSATNLGPHTVTGTLPPAPSPSRDGTPSAPRRPWTWARWSPA